MTAPICLRRLALLVGATTLAGCSLQPDQSDPLPVNLVDSYLIAHGMARSYVMSGRAGPGELTQLVRYDHAALIAVATAQVEPGPSHGSQAERALKALVDYTAANDLRPDPPPTTPPRP